MSILRRKLVRRACVVLALVAALGVAWLYHWPDRPGALTGSNFGRVLIGTAIEDVEAILGPPETVNINGAYSSYHWSSDTAYATVVVDADGVVASRVYQKRPLVETLRVRWSRATGLPAPF
jgi:hypothetical protein